GGVGLIEPLFIEIAQAEDLLKKEKERLEGVVQENEEELLLARRIQQRLLPEKSPSIPGFDIAGSSSPAEWTSGDYFDYMPMSDGTLSIVIADVSGHGTGPALLMTTTRSYLRALAQSHNDIGQILTIANRAIADDVDQGRFVTVFLAQLCPKQRTLRFTSAGHDGILLGMNGETQALDFGGPPLGAVADSVIQTADPIELQPGNILLLVSDGIPEAESPSRELFGNERMIQTIRENRDKSAREIVDLLLKTVRKFAGDQPQRDDITAVIVKVLP
ncbi:MAG: PP2C family protein-serine/threonine phosphatase, partial [Pirellulaceae bacterium]|nr:PP2C family protein-serine/threonine phosphatase [Pirellulaceae bacterium]